MRKRIFSALLCLSLLVCLLPVSALAVGEALEPYLKICDVANPSDGYYLVTEDRSSITQTGATEENYQVKVDGLTITLRDAVIDISSLGTYDRTCIYANLYNQETLTIILEGNNGLNAKPDDTLSSGIIASSVYGGQVTIKGGGSLSIVSGGSSISAKKLVMEDVAIISDSQYQSSIVSEDLTIRNAAIEVFGDDEGILLWPASGLHLENALVVCSSTNVPDLFATEGNTALAFIGDSGAQYGEQFTLYQDINIQHGKTLTIDAGQTLTIPEGVTLTNYGTLQVADSSALAGSGVLTGNGSYLIENLSPTVQVPETMTCTGSDLTGNLVLSDSSAELMGQTFLPVTPAEDWTRTITRGRYTVDEVIWPGTYTVRYTCGDLTPVEATFTVVSQTQPFQDVQSADWFYNDVYYAYARELMVGTSADLFSPDLSVTRGMAVAILYRLDGASASDLENPFADVNPNAYYADAIAWAAENQIVAGYSSGRFGPEDSLTREQLAAILYRYASYAGYDCSATSDLSGYTDADSVSAYAKPAISWANAEGLVVGTSDTTLCPRDTSTRAQLASILARFCLMIKK